MPVIIFVGRVLVGHSLNLWYNFWIAGLWWGINIIVISTLRWCIGRLFHLLNKRKQYFQVEFGSCCFCTFDIIFENGSSWESNALKPLMHEHDNFKGIWGYIQNACSEMGHDFSDRLSSNHSVIARISDKVSSSGLDIKELTLFRQWKEPSCRCNLQSDICSGEHLQMLIGIPSIIISITIKCNQHLQPLEENSTTSIIYLQVLYLLLDHKYQTQHSVIWSEFLETFTFKRKNITKLGMHSTLYTWPALQNSNMTL